MSRSGKYIYNVTAGDIITEALGLIGVYSPGGAIDASESADALRTLNMMLKALQPKIGLWLNKEFSLFLQDDTYKYNIGPTGDHCGTDAVKTEVATAAASGASAVVIDATTDFGNTFDRDGIVTAVTATDAGAITLTGALVTNGVATLSSDRKILVYAAGNESGKTFAVVGQNSLGTSVTETITGPNAGTVYSTNAFKTISSITVSAATAGDFEIGQVGDPVGIELDGGTIQWTNIGAALSTTLTLITTLTDAVAVDNHVYSYGAEAQRIIEIPEARLVKSDASEVPLSIFGRNQYMALSSKTSSGSPNQIYYDKQLDNGTLFTWPVCDDVQEYIKFTGRQPIQNLEGLTNDFELAQEWFEPIAWNLAWRLAPKYGKMVDAMFKVIAENMLMEASSSDSENTSVFTRIGYN